MRELQRAVAMGEPGADIRLSRYISRAGLESPTISAEDMAKLPQMVLDWEEFTATVRRPHYIRMCRFCNNCGERLQNGDCPYRLNEFTTYDDEFGDCTRSIGRRVELIKILRIALQRGVRYEISDWYCGECNERHLLCHYEGYPVESFRCRCER